MSTLERLTQIKDNPAKGPKRKSKPGSPENEPRTPVKRLEAYAEGDQVLVAIQYRTEGQNYTLEYLAAVAQEIRQNWETAFVWKIGTIERVVTDSFGSRLILSTQESGERILVTDPSLLKPVIEEGLVTNNRL